jgi:hypothetical protein
MDLFLLNHFLTKRNGKQETHGRRGSSSAAPNATIQLASTVFEDVVSFFPEGVVEMLEVAFANIFDPKIINRQVEPYLMGFVPPKAGGVRLFKVSMLS